MQRFTSSFEAWYDLGPGGFTPEREKINGKPNVEEEKSRGSKVGGGHGVIGGPGPCREPVGAFVSLFF